MKKIMMTVFLSVSSVVGAIECDERQYAFYSHPKFNYYMNSQYVTVESDNDFNDDIWYDYATWYAQYDWEAETKLTMQRDSGNTVINITVSNLGNVGWYGQAWTENVANLNITSPITEPQSICNIDINTYLMDDLLLNSEYSKFQAIIRHEIGHCLGLAHHGLTNEIMNYAACSNNTGDACVVSQDACYSIDNDIY